MSARQAVAKAAASTAPDGEEEKSPLSKAVDIAVETLVTVLNKQPRQPCPAEEALPEELMDPPAFGVSEVEVVQDDFVRHFRFQRVVAKPGLKRLLTSARMVRLVGLASHLAYWLVVRDHHEPRLLSETLTAYADIKEKAPASVMRVVLLSLHCAVERLFTSTYAWLEDHGDALLLACHSRLAALLDPSGYQAQLAGSPRLALRATSPVFHVLYPSPESPEARALVAKQIHEPPRFPALAGDDRGRLARRLLPGTAVLNEQQSTSKLTHHIAAAAARTKARLRERYADAIDTRAPWRTN